MFKPIPLNLPPHPFQLQVEDDHVYIFDELRKRFLLVTPEEWVRQHWIQHLMNQKGYPKALIQSEGGLTLHSLKKRTDLVIFNRNGERLLIAEFKAPSIKVSQAVFDQVARYNMVHRVPYLLVSNGLEHYYCKVDFERSTYSFLEELPLYEELIR
jgi:hypothetical protein